MKNSNYTIGNRTRGPPACSTVPQATALPPPTYTPSARTHVYPNHRPGDAFGHTCNWNRFTVLSWRHNTQHLNTSIFWTESIEYYWCNNQRNLIMRNLFLLLLGFFSPYFFVSLLFKFSHARRFKAKPTWYHVLSNSDFEPFYLRERFLNTKDSVWTAKLNDFMIWFNQVNRFCVSGSTPTMETQTITTRSVMHHKWKFVAFFFLLMYMDVNWICVF